MRSGSALLARLTRWSNAQPLAADTVFAIAVGALSVLGYAAAEVSGSETQQDLVGLLLIAAQTTGLAFRRTAPLRSFVAVITATVLFWIADYPTNFDIFSLLAVYAAIAHGGEDRRRVWTTVGSLVLLLTSIAIAGVLSPGEDLPVAAVFGIAAIHLTSGVAGEIVFERRQRLAALEQRAVRAESERELLARQAVLDERARIARDLHDIVAHGMSVMVVQAGAARRVVATQPDRAAQALEHIQETGRQALSEMRRMLGVLRNDDDAAALAPQPTIGDLDDVVQNCVEAGIPAEIIIEGSSPQTAAGIEMTGYRIVQEALTNVIKHAGVSAHAAIRVTYLPDRLRVEVTDDGDGATSRQLSETTGHGLIGMRERVELYGGSFHAGPRPGGGFRVAATIPFDAARQAS